MNMEVASIVRNLDIILFGEKRRNTAHYTLENQNQIKHDAQHEQAG
jgi:hypothetical protein